jgi:hypothetical protein
MEEISEALSNGNNSEIKLLKADHDALQNGSMGMPSANSHTSFSWPHQSSNSISFNSYAHMVKIIIPKFEDEDD